MARENTKLKIAMTALDLFSEKGYDGVGIELLAKTVGIRGASIYAHYKGKEEILDTIVEMMEQRYDEHFGNVANITDFPENLEALKAQCMGRIRFTMTDPQIRKVRRLCTIEQFRSEKLADLTTKHQLSGLMQLYKVILQNLMERGLIRSADLEILSLELVTPISVLIGVADREPQRIEEMMGLVEQHLTHFIRTYGVAPEAEK